MPRRRRREPAPRCCLVRGCAVSLPGWKWICDAHFRSLPFARRKAIAEAGEARAPHLVARLAMEAAEFLNANSPAQVAARRMGERE